MAGFVRRFTEQPTTEVIQQIEGLNIVDIAPPAPTTGVGSGTVLLVGEFEDGYFATDEEAMGSVEVFGAQDYEGKFGALGYTYGNVIANNPSAPRRDGEFWNGNGYMKSFKMQSSRLLISRVDTSVGEVSFDAFASVNGGGAFGSTFALATGYTLTVDTNNGAPATSAAFAATAALVAGSGESFASIASGDTFGIRVNGGPQTDVVFSSSDTTDFDVEIRINVTTGLNVAVANAGEIDFQSTFEGTASSIELIEVTPGVLAKLGHVAGITTGTGDAANVNSVTAAELATFVNNDVSLDGISVKGGVLANGTFRLYNAVSDVDATIEVQSSAIGTAAGFPVGEVREMADNPAGTIPAGTRITNAGATIEWVTMQTLDIPQGATGPFVVRVRHAIDDGLGLSSAAGTAVIVVDQPDFGAVSCTNPSTLTAALTEVQMDNAYIDALEATLDDQGPAKQANYLLSARRTDTLVREGRANAIKAGECGLFARIFLTGDPLGTDTSTIVANVDNYRSDRVFYTGKGLKVRVPAIAERGTDGGLGFTADGVITVRPDGPLATVCAIRPPEENPGQVTRLIDDFYQVDGFGERLTIEQYKAFKAAGVIVPKVEGGDAGTVFQSGVTSSLTSGRTTCARRKMADFIQNTFATSLQVYVKKLNTVSRRNAVRGTVDSFMKGLLSEDDPERRRIEAFETDDSVNAGNSPDSLALGIYRIQNKVRTLSSMDYIVVTSEVGENALSVTTD